MKCSNCNSRLSCGCQKRTASDGKSCCTSCISAYEQKLNNTSSVSTILNEPIAPKNIWNANRYISNKI